jgi:hypothetical protein
MKKTKFLELMVKQFRSITIEPVIFLSAISQTIISGSEVKVQPLF